MINDPLWNISLIVAHNWYYSIAWFGFGGFIIGAVSGYVYRDYQSKKEPTSEELEHHK